MTWIVFLLLATALIFAGVLLLRRGQDLHRSTGLPRGQVIYADTDAWEEVHEPLISRRYGLVGRPDYLVQVQEGGQRYPIPVEVKRAAAPPEPYSGHVLQLAAYCLLVEDTYRVRPPYGLLHYANRTLRIPFTDELRRAVLDTAAAIRAARRAPNVDRDHQDPARCRACGYRQACGDQALA